MFVVVVWVWEGNNGKTIGKLLYTLYIASSPVASLSFLVVWWRQPEWKAISSRE